jgi:hypothetical protein
VVGGLERADLGAADHPVRRALRGQARVQGEAGARIRAQGARVRRGEDDAAARGGPVLERPAEQRAADAGRLQVGPHDQQREAPQPVAQHRQPGAAQAARILGDPAARGIRGEDPPQPRVGRRGIARPRRRRRGLVHPPPEVLERRDRELVDAVDVVVSHRAELGHRGHDRAERRDTPPAVVQCRA